MNFYVKLDRWFLSGVSKCHVSLALCGLIDSIELKFHLKLHNDSLFVSVIDLILSNSKWDISCWKYGIKLGRGLTCHTTQRLTKTAVACTTWFFLIKFLLVWSYSQQTKRPVFASRRVPCELKHYIALRCCQLEDIWGPCTSEQQMQGRSTDGRPIRRDRTAVCWRGLDLRQHLRGRDDT